MKHFLKIWILVAAMVMGGALPPQLVGDNAITTQWSAQAKSKKKKHKNKHKNKSKSKSKREREKASLPAKSSLYSNSYQSSPSGKSSSSLIAVSIPRGVSNQVINYQSIRVNFNPSFRIPNCVAYELTATMVDMADAPGHESRKSYNYARDASVKACPENWEYRGSGYSRGHMAPAMDMRWDKTAMAQCFYMTNMCPQDIKLNNDHWRNLEEKVHRWAKRDKRLIVYTGPIMGKSPKKIGKNKANIAVPDAFFKVIYAPSQGRAIGFIYPNSPCPGAISKYAVTVTEVERRTGITFPSALPKHQCQVADWE